MSALEIVMLVGFASGAALHLYITWLIARREDRWGPEPAFIALGLTLGLWHAASLLAALFRILGVPDGHVLLRASDTFVFASLAFLPATLTHAHAAFLGWRDDYERFSRSAVRVFTFIGYSPLVLLPFSLSRLWTASYESPVDRMGAWLIAFSIWHVAVLFQAAIVDKFLRRYFTDPRERDFFDRLAMALVVIAVSYLAVYPGGLRQMPSLGPWLEVLVQLASIAPTTIVAYYIFRYNLYKLVIQRSLAYALLAGIAAVVYVFVVRTFDQFLVAQFNVRPGVIEAIGVVCMVLVAWPVRRAMDRSVRHLFVTEIGHYRTVVEQISTESHSFSQLRELLPYVESIVTEALGVDAVRIRLAQSDGEGETDEAESRAFAALWHEMVRDRLDFAEDGPKLAALGAQAAWGLWRDDELIGVMLIVASPGTLDDQRTAVLGVLSGQIAIAIENTRLVEEKVRLERTLMNKERLAALGQMAATVAHEIKNPLSAIKSIVQVMREESRGDGEEEDLRLIVGEVDRLNRTVTQLLSFSRPAVSEATPLPLGDVASSVSRLLEPDARSGGVTITMEVLADRLVSGAVANALREVLINLGLNAIQATPPGGRVGIALNGADERVALSVEDTGPGIPDDLKRKVREPFFTTRQRGTGLGLAIVERRLVEFGGNIHIESPITDGGGTRVSAEIRG
ncbi:MAG: ATP-binding protein [Blastocatellia bacterium]